MMSEFRFVSVVFFVLFICGSYIGHTEAVAWRSEQLIDYYTHYASVTPLRFPVPATAGKATWAFRATKSPSGCDHKDVSIYLQFGSLPVVNPHNETFPEHFYLGRTQLHQLDLKTDNVSVTHSQHFPQGGDWYAVAFIPERNDRITQKGLTMDCDYKVSASLELTELPPHLTLPVNHPWQMALDSSQSNGTWIGFRVPMSAQAVDVSIRDCSLDDCQILLRTTTAVGDLETDTTSVTENCSRVDNTTCSLHLPSPLLGTEMFVNMELQTEGNTTVVVEITSEDCLPPVKDIQGNDNSSSNSSNSNSSNNQSSTCVLERRLDRYQKDHDFRVDFIHLGVNNTVETNDYVLTNASLTVVPFAVHAVTDVGGTLRVQIKMKKKDLPTDQHVRACGLVTAGRFPGSAAGDLDPCQNVSNGFAVNSSAKVTKDGVSGSLYIPYPEQGLWTLALGLQCYNTTNTNSSLEVVDCANGTQPVTVSVKLETCVDGGCKSQGYCKVYIKGTDFIVFSTCDCSAGWRGYGCTDGSEAFSDMSQLLEVLLLTLSNLFFIPAIFIAAYRGYYVEAIVYFYNMFFSTFYHACDGDRVGRYVYCMTKYNVLATGDFLASTVSLWVTLVAMAQLPLTATPPLHMAGPLALLVGVLLDRHSLWVIAVPCALGLILVAICWTVQCCRSKRCFPERRRYLWMLPGVLFAAGGAVMFAFFETDHNYKYLHSAWHVCLSLAIVFLLPPRRKQKVNTSVNFDDTESTEGLVLGPNNYTRRMNFEL